MAVESLTNGPPAKRLFVGLQIYGLQAVKLAAMSKVMSMQFTDAGGSGICGNQMVQPIAIRPTAGGWIRSRITSPCGSWGRWTLARFPR